MENEEISNEMPEDFWVNNVSRTFGKHNIDQDAWERICKIRNSPIKLKKDLIVGENHKPHMVIPEGYKGFLIDYPEVFQLTDKELKDIALNATCCDQRNERLPAWFFGIDYVIFLNDDDYEIVPPYFDLGLANYGCENSIFK